MTSAVIVAVDQAGFVGDGAELPDNRLQLLVHHRAGVEPYRALVRCVALATDLRDFICGAPPAARPDGSSEVRKSLNSVYGLTNPSCGHVLRTTHSWTPSWPFSSVTQPRYAPQKSTARRMPGSCTSSTKTLPPS